jgi:hypothetical protein
VSPTVRCVKPDLLLKSALAFLDQFIGRGAAVDVHDVRRRLSTDEATRRLLLDQLHSPRPDEREGFDAFRRFLEIEIEQRGDEIHASPPGVRLLLSWTEFDPEDGQTSDPAQWPDWLEAVATAREADE